MEEQNEKNAMPMATFRYGGVKASVWVNKQTDKNTGTEYDIPSVKLVKVYKKGDEFKETNNYNKYELANAILSLKDAQRMLLQTTQKEA